MRTYTGSPLALRFWEHVAVPDSCWLWTGSRTKQGYGHISETIEGKQTQNYAHRVAWIVTRGPIPDGLWVLHKCDNPPCVNPDHLYLGTRADNVADAHERGRFLTGQRNPGAKLTDAEVEAIRTHPDVSYRVLAARFGVAPSTIWRVRRTKEKAA